MNESHRLAYLKVMGIDQYYPRSILSRAKKSPTFEFDPVTSPAREVAPVKTRPQSKTEAAPPRQDRSPASPRQQRSGPAPEPVPPAPAQQNEAPPTASTELTFSLAYNLANPGLAVIYDRLPQGIKAQQQQGRELLQAILRAIGVDSSCGDESEQFAWPMAAKLGQQQGAEQASLALQGFIRSKRERDGFSNLLLFTEQLGPLLGRPEQAGGNDFSVEFAGAELKLTLCHGLYSMLAVPALKRETWHGLQALRSRLQASS